MYNRMSQNLSFLSPASSYRRRCLSSCSHFVYWERFSREKESFAAISTLVELSVTLSAGYYCCCSRTSTLFWTLFFRNVRAVRVASITKPLSDDVTSTRFVQQQQVQLRCQHRGTRVVCVSHRKTWSWSMGRDFQTTRRKLELFISIQ